jgi:adenosylmethionine-8-amino-7-oxononanoate aminotransferase
LAQAGAIEAQLRAALEPCRDWPGVVDVRVKGAIGAVELDAQTESLRDAFADRGVWIRPFGRIVYLTPPLVIGAEDLSRLTDALLGVVGAWSRGWA